MNWNKINRVHAAQLAVLVVSAGILPATFAQPAPTLEVIHNLRSLRRQRRWVAQTGNRGRECRPRGGNPLRKRTRQRHCADQW